MSQTDGCLGTLPMHSTAISYEFEEPNFSVTTSTTGNTSYNTYTDNFDLSLLPQDYNNTITTNTATITTNITQTNLTDNNIPTTVYNFDTTTENKEQQILQQNKANSLAVPDIKIEQTWSSCPALNTIKQEQIYQSYFPLNAKQNQLVPPPLPTYSAYIYPSPQSSPAQSEYNFSHTQYTFSPSSSAACYESLSSSRNSLYNAVASPCPSLDVQTIKQEPLHILPPSPPESSCDTPTPHSSFSSSSSGFDFKSEPFDSDVETFNDLNKPQNGIATETAGHQLLLDYLKDTTTIQKRHALKPLALESFIGDLEEVRDNIEPVISLALEHAKREADATCAKLQISQDPSAWSTNQVHAWLRSTLQQYELPIVDDIEINFKENGAELLQLTEEEFIQRISECGSTLHAQLEIWKLTCSPEYSRNINQNQISQPTNMWTNNITNAYDNNIMEEYTEDEDDFLTNSMQQQSSHLPATNGQFANNSEVVDTNSNCINNIRSHINNNNSNNSSNSDVASSITPVKRTGTRNGGSHIHLWQFLKELLATPHINGTAIRWIDRSKGIFKIEDSVRVAKLWGKRKNRPAMNYDKLSRSIRQYYKKGIMKKTERSQRLVYQFCQPYHM